MNILKKLFSDSPPLPPPVVTDDDIRLIQNTPYQKLAEWYGTLNRWEWPSELYPSEVAEWVPNGRRNGLMDVIQRKVGEKYLLRHHNSDLTESEFEDFWQWSRNGDKEAQGRWEIRVKNKYAGK